LVDAMTASFDFASQQLADLLTSVVDGLVDALDVGPVRRLEPSAYGTLSVSCCA
jgi:hypothetical protein